MRYLLSLIFVLSIDLFAVTYPTANISQCNPTQTKYLLSDTVGSCNNSWDSDGYTVCNTISSNADHYVVTFSGEPYTSSCQKREITYRPISTCPQGQIANEFGVCEVPPPPAECSWAKSPWIESYRSQFECHNGNYGRGLSSGFSYLWNWEWCEANQKCYGLEYFCPAGQIWDSSISSCRQPKPPYSPDCANCGYYKQSGSIVGAAGKQCYIDYICKCNPKIRQRVDVSCGAGPVDGVPETPNPSAPTPEDLEPDPTPNTTGTGNCFAAESVARINCQSPKILSFQCDPRTGTVTKNECKNPELPTETPKNEGDDTKGATTADIKDLANKLPTSIRDALKDYLSDGSMPHLEAIRGQLQASVILDADRNDKLDSLGASVDSGLILQSDANEKLDGIRSSTDGIKGSVDGVKGSLDDIKNILNDDGSSVPTEELSDFEDSSIFDEVHQAGNKMLEDATGIVNQYDIAKSQISNGFPPVTIPNGSCPTIVGPLGVTVNLSKIGSYISPYSSLFALFIYIIITYHNLRFLFMFFIARSR